MLKNHIKQRKNNRINTHRGAFLVLGILILTLILCVNLVSAVVWNVSDAVYDNESKSVSSEETTLWGLFFKSDGTKMYASGRATNKVYQYTLSTAWNVSTATYDGKNKSFSSEGSSSGMRLSSDGTKMYFIQENSAIFQYTLSTAWDVSTATYDGSKSVSGRGLFFSGDGIKLYTVGDSPNTVHQYTLSTAWNVSTATIDDESKYVGDAGAGALDVSFKIDGTEMYIMGNSQNAVFQYTLSTAWNVSTATYNGTNFDFDDVAIDGEERSLFFKSDGTKMYASSDGATDSVYQFTLGEAPDTIPPNITINTPLNQSYNTNSIEFNITATDETAMDSCWYSFNSGITNYTLSNSGDLWTHTNYYISQGGYHTNFWCNDTSNNINNSESVDFYISVSLGWDISTAVYVPPPFDVSSEEGNPQAVFFRSDGIKMYITGSSGDEINEYTLSSAWNISTASYVQNFDVSTEASSPRGLWFKPDGIKMYVAGEDTQNIYQYNLSSAWNVTTASFVQELSTSGIIPYPNGLFFKNGTKMYIAGYEADIGEYTLSSAWNISTASLVDSKDVSGEETNPKDLFFKSDGTKMYIVGLLGNLTEYDLSIAWNVSSASWGQGKDVSGEEANPSGLFFKPDGIKMYITGTSGDDINQYDLLLADTSPPNISIVYPLNTTYNYTVTELNYTASDETALDTCWWSNNSGITNTTITCGQNISSSSIEGSNTWTVYANDTSGNENSDSVTFVQDIPTPTISMAYPLNTTYTFVVTDLNYSVSGDIDVCWYSLDKGATNSSTQTCGTNWTGLSSIEGSNTWTVYVNNSVGEENLDSVTFIQDTIPPTIDIAYPINDVHYDYNITTLNYTVSDVSGVNTCWYSLDLGTTNNTITCGQNVTGLNAGEGNYTWIIYANDTYGNENSTSVYFVVDITIPDLDWYAPTFSENPIVSSSPYNMNVSASDPYLDATNVTVYNESGEIIYTNFSGNLTETIFWMTDAITLNERNNILEVCARDSLTESPVIEDTAQFTKRNAEETEFILPNGNVVVREIIIKNALGEKYSAEGVNLVTIEEWIDGGRHYKTTWELDDINDGFLEIVMYDNNGDLELLTDRGVTRVIDKDRTYAWRYDDIEQSGYNVEYDIKGNGQIEIKVTLGDYVVTGGRWFIDPIVAGLNTVCENESIELDTTPPFVNVTYPVESIWYPTNTLDLKYTYIEINCDKAWYSLNGGATNSSSVSCGTNWTGLSASEGSNTWIVYMNDTLGHEGSHFTTFNVDITFPEVTIIYPQQNASYNYDVEDLNYTYVEINCNETWYSVNSGVTNSSVNPCGTNFTSVSSSTGTNTWILYIKDLAGNENSTSVTFIQDTTPPSAEGGGTGGSGTLPFNDSYTNQSEQNFTVNATDDIGIQNITFTVINESDDIINQTTVDTGGYGITEKFLGFIYYLWYEGIYKWYYTIVDIVGNVFTTPEYEITYDTTAPTVTLTEVINGSTDSFPLNVIFNYSITDDNLGNCLYTLDDAWVTDEFNNTLEGENLTFTRDESFTRYLAVPENITLDAGFLDLSGSDATGLNIVSIFANLSSLEKSNDIYVSDGYAYATSYTLNSLAIINITDKANPIQVAHLINNTGLDDVWGIVVDGNYAYVISADTHCLVIIDIINKTNPVQIGRFCNSTSMDTPYELDKQGNYVYTTGLLDSGGLTIIDVSTPTTPVQVGYLGYDVFGATGLLEGQYKVDAVGNYAYVIQAGFDINLGFMIVDITDKANPINVSHLNFTELVGFSADYGGYANLRDIKTIGNLSYIIDAHRDIMIILNVTNKTNPYVISNYTSNITLDSVSGLDINGDYAYLSSAGDVFPPIPVSNHAVTVLNISNKSNPTLLYTTQSMKLFYPMDIFYLDNYIYTVGGSKWGAYWSGNLSILNVSQVYPTDPYLEVGTLDGSYEWEYSGSYSSSETTSSLITPINNYLLSCSYINGYCYIPFLFHSDTAGKLEYSDLLFTSGGAGIINCSASGNTVPVYSEGHHNLTIHAEDLANNSAQDTSPFYVFYHNYTQDVEDTVVAEGEVITFNLTVSMTDISDSSATLVYEGTDYDADSFAIEGNSYSFEKALSIPAGSGNSTGKTTTWNWKYSIDAPDNTAFTDYTTTNQTQIVYSVEIDDCTNYTDVILNFTLNDEETDTLMNISLNPTIEIEATIISLGDESVYWVFNKTYNAITGAVCIPDDLLNYSDYRLDVVASYETDTYAKEFWYLDNGTLQLNNSNLDDYTTREVTLRELLLIDSTTFLFTYYDEVYLTHPEAIVTVLKKYIGEGTFKEVERAKEDNNGETHIHLVEEDFIYKFRITEFGELLFESSEYNAKCIETPCSITLQKPVSEGVFEEEFDMLEEGTYSISTNEDTRTVTLTFNLNETGTMNLSVFQYSNVISSPDTMACSDSATAKAGSIDCIVPLVYGNVTYYAVVRHNGDFIVSQWVDLTESGYHYFGTLGIFLGAILVLTLGLIAVSSGGWTIVFIILGLIIASATRLVEMDWYLLIWVICAGGIIIYKLATRRSI